MGFLEVYWDEASFLSVYASTCAGCQHRRPDPSELPNIWYWLSTSTDSVWSRGSRGIFTPAEIFSVFHPLPGASITYPGTLSLNRSLYSSPS